MHAKWHRTYREVKYYEDDASFLIIAKGRYVEHFNNACDLEVLGNIYQNKELLNA